MPAAACWCSREILPIIWLISRCVMVTLRFAAEPSTSAVSCSKVFASRVGKFRNVRSCTCSLVRRSRAAENFDELERHVGMAAGETERSRAAR